MAKPKRTQSSRKTGRRSSAPRKKRATVNKSAQVKIPTKNSQSVQPPVRLRSWPGSVEAVLAEGPSVEYLGPDLAFEALMRGMFLSWLRSIAVLAFMMGAGLWFGPTAASSLGRVLGRFF